MVRPLHFDLALRIDPEPVLETGVLVSSHVLLCADLTLAGHGDFVQLTYVLVSLRSDLPLDHLDFILWVPVSLISAEQPSDVVNKTPVERISKQFVASFKVFVCSFISEEQIVMVALQPVDEEPTESSEQGHRYR